MPGVKYDGNGNTTDAELAELAHRRDRRQEAVERGVERTRREVVGVQLTALAQRGRERVAHLGPDRLDRRGVVGEEPVRADVEHHVLGRAVDPRADETLGERLARRVDLHARASAGRARRRRRARRRCRSGCCGFDALRAVRATALPAPPRAPVAASAVATTAAAPPRRFRRRADRLAPPSGRGPSDGSLELTGGRLTAAVASGSSRFGDHRGRIAWHCASSARGSAARAPHSLKLALEQLLDGPCYHMAETFGRPADIPVWHAAANGRCRTGPRSSPTTSPPSIGRRPRSGAELADDVPRRHRAPLDPVERRRVVEERPRHHLPGVEAGDPERRTADVIERAAGHGGRHVREHVHRRPGRGDRRSSAYEAHNAAVRAAVDPGRLVDWQPGDGWEPICAALCRCRCRASRSRT